MLRFVNIKNKFLIKFKHNIQSAINSNNLIFVEMKLHYLIRKYSVFYCLIDQFMFVKLFLN